MHSTFVGMKSRPVKRTLGRRELVDFPAFALFGVEAKVDTGAYTSALHCTGLHEAPGPAGAPVLRGRLLDPDHPGFDGRALEFAAFTRRDIRSSNGEVQERYVIEALVQLYGKDFQVEFSLSDRSDMKYPVLLGRSLLRQGSFVVDVARRNLSRKAAVRAAARRAPP